MIQKYREKNMIEEAFREMKSAFVHMFEKPELENFAADVDRALIKIIESSIYSE